MIASIQYLQTVKNMVCGVKSHTCQRCLALHAVKMAVNKAAHHLWLLSHWSECRPVIKTPVNLPTQAALEVDFPQVNWLLQGWASFSFVSGPRGWISDSNLDVSLWSSQRSWLQVNCLSVRFLCACSLIISNQTGEISGIWCNSCRSVMRWHKTELSGASKWQATLHTLLHSPLRQIPQTPSLSVSQPFSDFLSFFLFQELRCTSGIKTFVSWIFFLPWWSITVLTFPFLARSQSIFLCLCLAAGLFYLPRTLV